MFEVMQHNLFLWPVALFALISLVIILERALFLFVRASVNGDLFFGRVQLLVLAGNLDGALAFCAADPWAPVARVVRAVLLQSGAGREEMTLALDQAVVEVTSEAQKRIATLAMIANVVTLIGLLGTIVGLIQSFAAVTEAKLEEKQTMLAAGISLAMYATAGGIAVAIPTLAAYSLLAQRANALIDDAERLGLKAVILMLARRQGEGSPEEAADAPVVAVAAEG